MQSSILLQLGCGLPRGTNCGSLFPFSLCLFVELLEAIGNHRLSQEQLTLEFYFSKRSRKRVKELLGM